MKSKVWEGRFFRHYGTLSWRCGLCGERGSGSFKLASSVEEPPKSDYDEVLVLAEVEHAVRCVGSLSLEEVRRDRYVEHGRVDISFGRDGTPHLFVCSDRRAGPGRYEELTMYHPGSAEFA